MSESIKVSKTEMQGEGGGGVKILGIPFISLRKSDLYYYFLPAFYLTLISIFYLYLHNFGPHKPGMSLEDIFKFIKEYKFELFLFITPFLYIFLYLLGIIISQTSSFILSKISKHADQAIQKETYEYVGYTDKIIKSLNKFYGFKLSRAELYHSTTYWCIFNYVMDYYYAQENVYDDLRKALFIRNLIGANIILFSIILINTMYSCKPTIIELILVIFLILVSFFFYHIYKKSITAYHLKLLRTYIYISTYMSNLDKKK